MPDGEKKGITVRIDADLHAEVSRYLKDRGMTMAEFVTLALDDELHPKMNQKEGQNIRGAGDAMLSANQPYPQI